MVLVDWAGTGRGPRLWSLAFLLYAEAAKEPRRAGAVLLGYREHVTLETEELDRLGRWLGPAPSSCAPGRCARDGRRRRRP
jgi:Ser/Thr protein kinase RdoA (MazF antagonist)